MQVQVLDSNSGVMYRVQKGDTLERIAKKLGVEKEYILRFNNISNEIVEAGDMLFLPRKNIRVHIVAPLDTLPKIAQKYGISEQEIIKKNNISTLFIGQKLYL